MKKFRTWRVGIVRAVRSYSCEGDCVLVCFEIINRQKRDMYKSKRNKQRQLTTAGGCNAVNCIFFYSAVVVIVFEHNYIDGTAAAAGMICRGRCRTPNRYASYITTLKPPKRAYVCSTVYPNGHDALLSKPELLL